MEMESERELSSERATERVRERVTLERDVNVPPVAQGHKRTNTKKQRKLANERERES